MEYKNDTVRIYVIKDVKKGTYRLELKNIDDAMLGKDVKLSKSEKVLGILYDYKEE